MMKITVLIERERACTQPARLECRQVDESRHLTILIRHSMKVLACRNKFPILVASLSLSRALKRKEWEEQAPEYHLPNKSFLDSTTSNSCFLTDGHSLMIRHTSKILYEPK